MVGPSKALQCCPLLKVHLGESRNRKAMPWPLPGWIPHCCTVVQGGLYVCLQAAFADRKTAHTFNSAGCPPQLQLTVLLLSNGPEGKISVRETSHCTCTEKGDHPLGEGRSVFPQNQRGQQEGEGLWAHWLCWPVSGMLLFLFCEAQTTSSSIKWDITVFLAYQTVTANRLVWNAFLKK